MQFVKGQSSNLKGRPKTTDRSLSKAILKDGLKAYRFVQKAMKEGESWAYDLYFISFASSCKRSC